MVETETQAVPEPDLSLVAPILDRYCKRGESGLLPALQEIQGVLGYLPRAALEQLAKTLPVALSRIYGVVTFYAQFHLLPRARHIIKCCQGTACHVRGASRVLDEVARQLEVKPGEPTRDGLFTIERVNCLGTCALAPVIMLDETYHPHITPEKLRKLIEEKRKAAEEGPHAEAD